MDVIDRRDGSYIARFRLLKASVENVIITVLYDGRQVAASPYKLMGKYVFMFILFVQSKRWLLVSIKEIDIETLSGQNGIQIRAHWLLVRLRTQLFSTNCCLRQLGSMLALDGETIYSKQQRTRDDKIARDT